jgi:hypothetical protein
VILLAVISKSTYIVIVKKTGRGGPRPGAGRPRRPSEEIQRNRVVVLLADAEFEKLERWADERRLALGTLAREIIERALRRRD